jgi:myo-inositol 2-dehydrogenase/D-chiro-inositol 1-dehydrogenase
LTASTYEPSSVFLMRRYGRLLNFFMSRYTTAYAAEIAAFVEAATEGTPPPTTGRDGLMALALADAAVRSVAEARVVRMADVLGSGEGD